MNNSTLAHDIAALSPRVLKETIQGDDSAEKAHIAVYSTLFANLAAKPY